MRKYIFEIVRDLIVILCVCSIGAIINTQVDGNTKYIVGFTTASILDLIRYLLRYSKER